MKKGFYFIAAAQEDNEGRSFNAPVLEEGSFEHYGLLMVNRPVSYGNRPNRWKISHINSGACVQQHLSLPQARKLVKSLQGFRIWNIEGYDDIQAAVSSPDHSDEVDTIKALCTYRRERSADHEKKDYEKV